MTYHKGHLPKSQAAVLGDKMGAVPKLAARVENGETVGDKIQNARAPNAIAIGDRNVSAPQHPMGG